MDDPISNALRKVVGEELDRRMFRGEPSRWLPFAQAADYLGISERRLRDFVHEGRFRVMRHVDAGPKYLDRYELDKYTEECKRPQPAERAGVSL